MVSQRIRRIQELLLNGYSPSDLQDERIFNPPFSSAEVWKALMLLNREVVANVQ